MLAFFKQFLCFSLLVLLGWVVTSKAAWSSAYNVQATQYNFQDIKNTGQVLLEQCDDCSRAVDIGFVFTYFGRSYSQLFVSSNGFVVPGGARTDSGGRFGCCIGSDIPHIDNIEGVIAPWWTDLSMRAHESTEVREEDGQVLYQLLGSEGSYVLLIQFDAVRHFHNLVSNEANTFQIKFFQADNRIEFHYKNVVMNKSVHSIGIESPRQDEGEKIFRSSDPDQIALINNGKNHALAFQPTAPVKLTSSVRYAATGNKLEHVFEVDQALNNISEIQFNAFLSPASLAREIDFNGAVLKQQDPARFALTYTLFNSLSSETGGVIGGDFIDFSIDGLGSMTLDSQTIFIEQRKIIDADEVKIRDVAVTHDATLAAFRSKDNLLDELTKSANAGDVFFTGRDPDTFVEESFQLTKLSGSQQCGQPYIDGTGSIAYLYVLCEVSGPANQVALYRFNLDSYLADDQVASSAIISGSEHAFAGDVEAHGLVVAAGSTVAYARDDNSDGSQDVFLNGSNINTTSGLLKSLAIDDSGQKIIYVIDSSLYFYDGEETLIDNNVESAHLSSDGSLIAFSSSSDLDSGKNGDGSQEVFTAATQDLVSLSFSQETDLPSGVGVCKQPQLNQTGERLAVICNADLLALGNDFSNREAVFIIETTTGERITHLISGTDKVSGSINSLVMSGDGATLSFEDAAVGNAFRLLGLTNLDTSLEENPAKNYPIPFILPGDGKSGSIHYVLYLLVCLALFRFSLRHVELI